MRSNTGRVHIQSGSGADSAIPETAGGRPCDRRSSVARPNRHGWLPQAPCPFGPRVTHSAGGRGRAMSIAGTLECFLGIVRESQDYFISGSLSFLPLLPHYRVPKHDVDVGISVDLFEQRRAEFEAAGRLRILRLREVAVVGTSRSALLLVPCTGFMHINTPEGLIDLAQFSVRGGLMEFFLGAGLTVAIPSRVLERVRQLEWAGIRFRAGPPELALIPKLLWYLAWKNSRAVPTADEEKHLLDLRRAHGLIDWDFVDSVLAEAGLYWLGRRFPRFVDRAVNPFRKFDVTQAREELERLATQQGDEAHRP